ncbi:MAG TPA: hypothetical protein VG101_04455 [Puia sp.]|jgi:hypothetical protein|nr:hypothetical protein [Puia sp.]
MNSRIKKRHFAFVAAFFLIQIAIDLAHSVTAFPFVHYGMFSESFPAPDSLLRYEVIVNGKTLDPADFRIYRWDMIQGPLAAFDKQVQTADFAFDKEKFRAALPGIYSRISANLDNSPALAANFPEWYRNYLSSLLRRPIRTLLVNRARYRFEDNRFILMNSTPWIDRE